MTTLSETRGEVPRFLVAGIFTSILDLGLFSLLAVVFGISAVPSNVISTIVTVCVSYFINQNLVFRARTASLASFFSFAGVTLFTGLVLQSGVITVTRWFAAEWLPDMSLSIVLPASKVLAMAVGAVVNFLSYRYIFRR